jgi:hypothetical protein
MTELAEDRKLQRLEAWRRKQQPTPKVSLSLMQTKKKTVAVHVQQKPSAFFDDSSSDEEESGPLKRPLVMLDNDNDDETMQAKKKRRGRWDQQTNANSVERDALDLFMDQLEAGAVGEITTGNTTDTTFTIDVSGSMTAPVSLRNNTLVGTKKSSEQLPKYTSKDWLSDSGASDDEQEEEARRKLIEALKAAPVPMTDDPPLAAHVKSEKKLRQDRLRQLEQQAAEARLSAEQAAAPELGRLYVEDGSVMEEAERNWEAMQAAPDALAVLAELNKKKELKAADQLSDYIPFTKNLYRVPRSLATMTNDQICNARAKLHVRVRGQGAPAPVTTFEECGLSEKILRILQKQNITTPFPVQAQCIPCIMGKFFCDSVL